MDIDPNFIHPKLKKTVKELFSLLTPSPLRRGLG
jgi:hypothetical protein